MKVFKNLFIFMLIAFLLVGSCSAVSLLYWDAYSRINGIDVPTSNVFFCSVPLVGKVFDCETTEDQVKAATAMVYGQQKWNNTNGLPFSLSFLYYNSQNPYNVIFMSGTLEWLQELIPEYGDGDLGYTKLGTLDDINTQATYGGGTKDIQRYSVTGNNNAVTKTKIGVLNTSSDGLLQITGAHELGHALGWVGHSTDTSQLMNYSAGDYSVTAVGEKDLRHIKQIYDLYYD